MSEDIQDAIDISPDNDKQVQCNLLVKSAPLFDHFTRDSDVKLCAGFSDSSTFRLFFDQLAKTAQYMHYWKSMTNAVKDLSSPRDRKNVNLRKSRTRVFTCHDASSSRTNYRWFSFLIWCIKYCWQVKFSPLGLSSCLKNLDGWYFGLTEMLFEGTFQPAFESIIYAAQLSLTAQKYL